jgi:hypothetical protein
VEVCAAADETFFDQVILVMLDLPSGLKVKYLVSDRAKAIVKLALKDLGAASIEDLLHVLYNLNRSLALELNCLGAKLQKQLNMEQDKGAKPELIEQIETKA